jgi:hypothetical protein
LTSVLLAKDLNPCITSFLIYVTSIRGEGLFKRYRDLADDYFGG